MTTKDLVPVLQKEMSPMVAQATSLVIKDADSMTTATEMLSSLNKIGDQIEGEKKKITDPLNKALKEVRSRYKPLEATLETATDAIRRKMSDYQTKAKQIADAKADKIADRVERGTLKPETGVAKIAELDTPAEKVSTDSGSVQFRTIKHWRVTDFALLPDTHKITDEKACTLSMKSSREVAGLEYYETQEPYNTR